MAFKLYILVVAVWLGWAEVQATDYCRITTEDTMCKYSWAGPNCWSDVVGSGVSSSDAAAIVKLHNEFRAQVANGRETRGAPGPQPSGANIRALEWDAELAAVAQRLTDQCVNQHECIDCHRVDRFGVGQNLNLHIQPELSQTAPDWFGTIKVWYDEVALFPNSNTDNYLSFTVTADTGRATVTTRNCCGRIRHSSGAATPHTRKAAGLINKLYACNYGPNGNTFGSQMYLVGHPCSACPASCSQQYRGLCGRK